MRGICHRCWKEGELLEDYPVTRGCFGKIPQNPNHIYHPSFSSHSLYEVIFWRSTYTLDNVSSLNFNFFPIYFEYSSEASLRWGKAVIDELDLAINIMTLAYPPQSGWYGGVPFHRLTRGSLVTKDVWNLHHFFRSEFIEKIPYQGGSIDLQEVRNWIDRYGTTRGEGKAV